MGCPPRAQLCLMHSPDQEGYRYIVNHMVFGDLGCTYKERSVGINRIEQKGRGQVMTKNKFV